MGKEQFAVKLDLREGFTFGVDFGMSEVPELIVDEPPPLGAGAGPNAARLLAGAIGNCLGASLLYCLQRSRVDVTGLGVTVEGSMERNEAGRLRISEMRVRIEPSVTAGAEERMSRCLELFEDYCTVTASVREGIDVDVEVVPAAARKTAIASTP